MPYTLVSAATLGFDLVRLPAGRAVAEVLLVALSAGPHELEALAAHHPLRSSDAVERATWPERSRRAREVAATGVPGLPGAPGTPAQDAGRERLSALLTRLEVGMLGDAAALERLLRLDVIAEGDGLAGRDGAPGASAEVAAQAADVLADAAVCAYAAGALPRAVRRELSRPFVAATADTVAPQPDLGPQAARLQEVLGAVREAGAPGRARWRAAVDAVRGHRRPWAASLHDACWAAHVSGRTRAAAAAHLLAVQAFDDAGLDAADGAQGVWNALAGCVQALVVADLLEDSSMAVLCEPWELVTGTALVSPS